MSPEIAEAAAMPADLCDRLTAAIPALRRFALSLSKDRDEAADLVQETCLRALAFWHQWRPNSDFENWLFQITRNLWIDRIRSRQSRERTVEAVKHLVAGFVDGQRVMEQRLTLGSIREILSHLPQEQQEILLNVAIEGLSYKDASARLSTPIGTVMSRLSRARRALHGELGGPVTTGLILALLLPFLDREARAEVEDLGALDAGSQGPPAGSLPIGPFLPLLGREGRGGSAGPRIAEVLRKAQAAIAREMEGGAKGPLQGEVAASLFFLLLVDLALADQAAYQQLRDLFERASGEPGPDPEGSYLALEDSDGSVAAGGVPEQSDQVIAAGPGGGPSPGDLLLDEIPQDADPRRPPGAESHREIEQAASGPAVARSPDPAPSDPQPTDIVVAGEAGDETARGPALQASAPAGEAAGADEPLSGPVQVTGLKPAGQSTIAFVLGQRLELEDRDSQDHRASLLRALLGDDDAGEEDLFENGEAMLPAAGYWTIAESDGSNEPPVTIGELLEMSDEGSPLSGLIEDGGDEMPQMAVDSALQRSEQVAAGVEPGSLDLQTENDVHTDLS